MKRRLPLLVLVTFLVAGSMLSATPEAAAQELRPRFGLGANATLATTDGVLGLGLRGRISAPVNPDLSFAIDLGFTGFVLRGRDDATYVFDPQVSAIVTLDARGNRSPYIIGGIGAYVPFEEGADDDGGPTLHGGFGWVQTLQSTTLFYEVDPALIIGKSSVDLVLPFRIGIIF